MAARKSPVASGKSSKQTNRKEPLGTAPFKKRRVVADKTMRDADAAKLQATDKIVAAVRHNENKPLEYGKAAKNPKPGRTVKSNASDMGSTVTESNPNKKVGGEKLSAGKNPANGTFDRVRVDSSAQELTTNQGVRIADNQNSLKAGLRGPTLMEDFILREKITHFDHERIPERIVHARGSGAHGYFECYKPLTEYTKASLFCEIRKTDSGVRALFDCCRGAGFC